jgi:fluoride ion exporter CrcB/FEX
MWFKTLSLILAILCVIEGTAGLVCRRAFDAWIQRQFAAPAPSGTLRVLLVYAMTLALATWYATLLHYARHGWVVTLVMTVVGLKALALLVGWRLVSAEVVRAIERSRALLGQAYLLTLLLGGVFLWLGLVVY